MPLFGKRKSAVRPVPQQQTVDQRALEEAQSVFSAGFKTWLDGVARAQAETGGSSLSHEILDRVGAVPQPQGSTTLNRTQLIFLRSYALPTFAYRRGA